MNNPSHDNADHPADEAWLQKALTALDSSEQGIDYVTRAKLSAARARAVDTESRFRWFGKHTAATAVTLAVCAVVFMNLPQQQAPAPAPMMASQDLPILSSGEDLEFYQSLEFLEWMDDSYPEINQELQG